MSMALMLNSGHACINPHSLRPAGINPHRLRPAGIIPHRLARANPRALTPELQKILDDLHRHPGAQDMSLLVPDNTISTGPPESRQDMVIVQATPQSPKDGPVKRQATASKDGPVKRQATASKDGPVKRQATSSKDGPVKKKGSGKRHLKGAAQKNIVDDTHKAKRATNPLADITKIVLNTESAAKGVSRRVRQDKLCSYYSHIHRRTGTSQKCQSKPSPSMLTPFTGQSVLPGAGVKLGVVLTTPTIVNPVLCKKNSASMKPLKSSKGKRISNPPVLKKKQLNPTPKAGPLNLKKTGGHVSQPAPLDLSKKPQGPEPLKTPLDLSLKSAAKHRVDPPIPGLSKDQPPEVSVAETPLQPQPSKVSKLSRKYLKIKQLIETLEVETAEGSLNKTGTPQPASFPLKPSGFSNKLTNPSEECPVDQPLKTMIVAPTVFRVNVSEKGWPLGGTVDSLEGNSEAAYEGPSNNSNGALQTFVTPTSPQHPDRVLACSNLDYCDNQLHSPLLMSPIPQPGAYEDTREAPAGLEVVTHTSPVFIPNPPKYDSIKQKPILDAYVKDIQLAVRKLKRQAVTCFEELSSALLSNIILTL